MRCCKRLQYLDSNQTLEALFSKLTIEIQRKWEKEVFKSPDQEPTYELLMRAVREVHRQKTSELGQWEEALLAAQASDSAGCEDEGNTCSVSSDEASALPNSKHASDEFQFKLPPPPDENRGVYFTKIRVPHGRTFPGHILKILCLFIIIVRDIF